MAKIGPCCSIWNLPCPLLPCPKAIWSYTGIPIPALGLILSFSELSGHWHTVFNYSICVLMCRLEYYTDSVLVLHNLLRYIKSLALCLDLVLHIIWQVLKNSWRRKAFFLEFKLKTDLPYLMWYSLINTIKHITEKVNDSLPTLHVREK